MNFIKHKKIFRLFLLLNERRKKQIYLLIFLLIINGILESLSTSTIIPFLTLLVSENDFIDLGIINKLSINNSNQLLLNLNKKVCQE